MSYLAALVVVTPLVLVYALVVRWVDRFEPEPWWILALCFGWGAVGATVGGGVSTAILEGATQSLFTGGSDGAAALDAFSTTVYAPIAEEAWKGLGVIVVFVLGALVFREFDGPLDGVVYGGIIGLGFTLTEDTLYIGQAGATDGVTGFVTLTVLRTIFAGLAHALYTSMTGLGWGLALRARSWFGRLVFPCAGFAAAVGLHAFHNALPSYGGEAGGLATVVLTWFLQIGWFGLIAILVFAERRVVLRQLGDEVGGLVRDPRELAHVATLLERSFAHLGLFFSRGPAIWSATRRRHRALVELALVKDRRGRGDLSPRSAQRERELRAEIVALAQQGAV